MIFDELLMEYAEQGIHFRAWPTIEHAEDETVNMAAVIEEPISGVQTETFDVVQDWKDEDYDDSWISDVTKILSAVDDHSPLPEEEPEKPVRQRSTSKTNKNSNRGRRQRNNHKIPA